MDGRNSLVATIGLSSYDAANIDLDEFDKIAEQEASKAAEARSQLDLSIKQTTEISNDENDGAVASMWW